MHGSCVTHHKSGFWGTVLTEKYSDDSALHGIGAFFNIFEKCANAPVSSLMNS
jgi:hypothetical protein